jgi:hypothetical protein
MSEGNPFFPLPSDASEVYAGQQQPAPYAQILQEIVGGTLPPAVSVATSDARVDDVKVRRNVSCRGSLLFSSVLTLFLSVDVSCSLGRQERLRCSREQLQSGVVSAVHS